MPDGIGGKGVTGSEAPFIKKEREKTNDKREKADNRKTELLNSDGFFLCKKHLQLS